MSKVLVSTILLFINILWANRGTGQTLSLSEIRLARIILLTSSLDSLTRSFIKKGYRIKTGIREPGGVLNNRIIFPNGCEIIIETTTSSDPGDWRNIALKKYGNHISGIAFESDHIDSLYHAFQINEIPLSRTGFAPIEKIDDSKYPAKVFALDSCAPLDIVFFSKDSSRYSHSQETDSLTNHPNHVFRFDWVLLSGSALPETRLRKIFDIIGARKLHEGCCDFWRLGPSDDFCFFRFEPPPKKNKGKPDWLSIEPDNIYFAY